MPAPSQLSIATSSLNRLVKEEASYHREHQSQQTRITKLEQQVKDGTGDENAEFSLRQEVSLENLQRVETSFSTLFTVNLSRWSISNAFTSMTAHVLTDRAAQ